MSYPEYKADVLDRVEKLIGGKPKFLIDEFEELGIWDSFGKRHYPSIVARVIVDRQIKKAKGEDPDD